MYNVSTTSVSSTSTTSLVDENSNKRKYSSEISESIDRNVRPAIDCPSTTLTPAPLKSWMWAMSQVEQPLFDLVTYGIIDYKERKSYLSELIPSSFNQKINLDQWTSQVFGKIIQSIESYADYYSLKDWKQSVSSSKFDDFSVVVNNIIRIQIVIYKNTFSTPFKTNPVTKKIDWPPYIKSRTEYRMSNGTSTCRDTDLLIKFFHRFSFPVLLKNPEIGETLKLFIKNYREYLMKESLIDRRKAIQIAMADDLLQQAHPVITLQFENEKTILLNQAQVDVISKHSEALGKHFSNNMQEETAKKVLLKEVSWDDFTIFIKFLFHDDPLPVESFGSLFLFADMYLIETLFQECLNVLKEINFDVKENHELFNKSIEKIKNILIESKWEKVNNEFCSHLLSRFFHCELKTLPDCPLLKPTFLELCEVHFNKIIKSRDIPEDALYKFINLRDITSMTLNLTFMTDRIEIYRQMKQFPNLTTLTINKLIRLEEVLLGVYPSSLRHLTITIYRNSEEELQIQDVFSKLPHLEKIDIIMENFPPKPKTFLSFDRQSKP